MGTPVFCRGMNGIDRMSEWKERKNDMNEWSATINEMNQVVSFTRHMSPKGGAFGDVEISDENSFVPLAGAAANFDVHISVDLRYSAGKKDQLTGY